MVVSDCQINLRIRGVFARHWLDLQELKFASIRGTVRVSGKLRPLGTERAYVREPINVTDLEFELRNIRGVKRVYLDLQK